MTFLRKFSAFIFIMTFSFMGFSLEIYRESATASFYGADFHGKKTSNGEHFDMHAYTCANKELPFDTLLKVTNLANNKTVQVRVNDRGPFVAGRDIDLSTQAAIDLEMTKSGLAKVKLEIVQMGPDTKLSRDTAASARKIMAKITGSSQVQDSTQSKPAEQKAVAQKAVEPGKQWDIQVGSFKTKENAAKLAKTLSVQGFKKIVFQTTKAGAVRVVVSRIPSENLAATQEKLRAAGYKDFVTRERKSD